MSCSTPIHKAPPNTGHAKLYYHHLYHEHIG